MTSAVDIVVDIQHLPSCVLTADVNTSSRQVSLLPYISMDEVKQNCYYGSCWVIIHNKVYDVTTFLTEHPGGEDIILEQAGWDATVAFSDVHHSTDALILMEKYFIGRLHPMDIA